MSSSTPQWNPQIPREALAFAPALLSLQEDPPAPLPRAVLYAVAALFLLLIAWATFGKLDIIASATGHLVPRSYVKIVQPADGGIVQEILVQEGQAVAAGQVLLRMDASDAQADTAALTDAQARKGLELRRIQAELGGRRGLPHAAGDPPALFARVQAQFDDRRRAYRDAVEKQTDAVERAKEDLQAGTATLEKLQRLEPSLAAQADSYRRLGQDGYVPRVLVDEKQRQFLENDQELRAQQARVASLQAAIAEESRQRDGITSKYRSDLQNEMVQAQGEYEKLTQEVRKQEHKDRLLELRAPQAGVVKDIATHTVGSVVSAGTVLLSLVPEHEPLRAEVMIRNADVGFVRVGQAVEVKLAAYPFQKYGTIRGQVAQISPDSDAQRNRSAQSGSGNPGGSDESAAADPRTYRALIDLDRQSLNGPGGRLRLLAGMDVSAEIQEGKRTVLNYILSPIEKTFAESGGER